MQMEKKNLKLKNKFSQLIGQVSKMYKEVSNSNDEAYLSGRKEALEEILNWFVSSQNGELKYVSATSFFNMIQEKLTKTKTALATKIGEDAEEEIKPTMNFSEIKISDNRKRTNKYATMQDSINFYGYPSQNEQNMVVENQSGTASTQNNVGISSQINFPITIGSLINTNSDNSIQLNNNNISFDTLRSNNISSSISNASNTNGNSDIFIQNQSTSINSLSEYTQSHGNIFSSNLQPGLFLPNRKRKSMNK